MKYEDLLGEYEDLWCSVSVTKRFERSSRHMANKIISNKHRYKELEERTGVPWYWIGCVHAMESGCRFSTHLHNGDPLTARTRLIPKGRPRSGVPPFKWEDSAEDALTMKGLHQVTDWSIPRMLYEFERYNGWGYRKYHQSTLSPYLWSGTPHYRSGKYVSDGKWDGSAVSKQTGAAALLLRIDEYDDEVKLIGSRLIEAEGHETIDDDIAPETYPKAVEASPRQKAAVVTAVAVPTTSVAVANTPPSIWESGMVMVGKMGSFATANWQTVAAIGGVTAALMILPRFFKGAEE